MAEGRVPAGTDERGADDESKLKRLVKGANFKKKAKDTAGGSAAIAAIAQGSMADISEAKGRSDQTVVRFFGRHDG